MKMIRLTITLFALFSFYQNFAQTYAEHRAVQARAYWDPNDLSVVIEWDADEQVQSYILYRRDWGERNWGNAIASLPATDRLFRDSDIDTTAVYEYVVVKQTSVQDPLNTNNSIRGYGYITWAIHKPEVHNRGVMGVLVSTLIQDSMPEDVRQLTQDLTADGWTVFKSIIAPGQNVADVEAIIDYNIRLSGCNALYLLGNIPVPYSGLYCADPVYQSPPDGHGKTDPNSHCGAWPADVFYGTIYGAWTDNDSTTLAKREENKNRIGDEKFDNIRIPGKVTIGVGRVDFSQLPILEQSEVALTRQYLRKIHQFKMGQENLIEKGIIEDNFSPYAEGFSSAAIRDFSAICGKDRVLFEDVLTANTSTDYLLSYACGAGSYSSCSGFGNTQVFNTQHMAAFNQLFGSFFGDFDSKNNLLKGSLASPKLGFATFWSGRPKWVTHPLALGETLGNIALISQNNWGDYDANYYQNTASMALLGDPSLRLHMIPPPSEVQASTNANRNEVTLQWQGSADPNVLGYQVYRSRKKEGSFGTPIHAELITDLQYIDQSPFQGNNYYLVKAVTQTTTGSGSYRNMSLGIMDSIANINGSTSAISATIPPVIKLYPTLAHEKIYVERTHGNTSSYTVYNSTGSVVDQGTLTDSKTVIDIQFLQAGVYYMIVEGLRQKFIRY